MSVSVAPSVLIVTVPLAGSGAAGSIEMSASVTFPDRVSFVRGCADTCMVLRRNNPSPALNANFKHTFFIVMMGPYDLRLFLSTRRVMLRIDKNQALLLCCESTALPTTFSFTVAFPLFYFLNLLTGLEILAFLSLHSFEP